MMNTLPEEGLLYRFVCAIERWASHETLSAVHPEYAEGKPRKAEDDKPLKVSVGDTVYLYDEDECELRACPVVSQHEDHHYALESPCKLTAVSEGWFYETQRDAAEVARESIEHDLQYHSEMLEKARKAATFLKTR